MFKRIKQVSIIALEVTALVAFTGFPIIGFVIYQYC